MTVDEQQNEENRSRLCGVKKRALLLVVIFLLAYLGSYAYVRSRWAGHAPWRRGWLANEPVLPRGTVFCDGGVYYRAPGRKVCYYLFYPAIRIDLWITGRAYYNPDGRRVE